MTTPWDEGPQLERAEEQFIARLAAHYVPTPMPPGRRVAWEAALWARLQRRPRRRLVPALATVSVAVVAAWLTLPRLFMPVPEEGKEPHLSVVTMSSSEPLAYELIYPREFTGAHEPDEMALLPDDYRMIAQVFLD